MEQRTEPGAEVITIISEPGALTFATRKEWQQLPEVCLDELYQHEIVSAFCFFPNVYFLLRNHNPGDHLKDNGRLFRLVKISYENRNQVFNIMNLSRTEAAQLICALNPGRRSGRTWDIRTAGRS